MGLPRSSGWPFLTGIALGIELSYADHKWGILWLRPPVAEYWGAHMESVTEIQPDKSWPALVELDEATRSARMRERFQELMSLPKEERLRKIAAMTLAQYELTDEGLYTLTASWLRTWVAIAAEAFEQVQTMVQDYDTAFDLLPSNYAWRRVEVVQHVGRERLTAEEIEVLQNLGSSMVQYLPRMRRSAVGLSAAEQQAHDRPTTTKRPFWKRFGKP